MSRYIILATLIGAGLLAIPAVPSAHANSCDVGSIVPADNSYTYSSLPFCDGEAVLVPAAPGVPYGYTSPGNTPFVNGQPQVSPFSNVSTYTPRQAAEQRANGNASASSNAYSQYGGFTPPGNTATRESSPSYVIKGH